MMRWLFAVVVAVLSATSTYAYDVSNLPCADDQGPAGAHSDNLILLLKLWWSLHWPRRSRRASYDTVPDMTPLRPGPSCAGKRLHQGVQGPFRRF